MAEANQEGARALSAIMQKLKAYNKLREKSADLLEEGKISLADHLAFNAKIDIERIPLEAKLEALSEGALPIEAPTSEQVQNLRDAVQGLAGRVAASNALDNLLNLFAEAVETFGSES